jgi:SAM-dependent methyltransferase
MLLRRVTAVLLYVAIALAVCVLVLQVADLGPVTPPPVASGASGWASPPARAAYPYEPRYGQPGKDVVWIPSDQAVVDTMLDLGAVTQKDLLVDLGSGDGRIVIGAAQRGARALGIEYDPGLVGLSRRRAAAAGVADRASFVRGDIFEADLSRADAITLFLLPEINLRLRPKLLGLRPGTRVLSNTFTMDDWLPDATVPVRGDCQTWCVAFLWFVPANVEGVWHLADGTLTLKQRYQSLDGVLTTRRGERALDYGLLRGAQIRFTLGDARYEGRVSGDTMAGTVDAPGRRAEWRATRVR